MGAQESPPALKQKGNMFMRMALLAAGAVLALGTGHASALTITPTADINVLTNALLAPGAGIAITSRNLVNGTPSQQGTFTGFNLVPSSGSGPTLTLGNGVALSSGNVNIGSANTQNETTVNTGNGGYAPLTTLARTISSGVAGFNANVLEFSFTLDAGFNAIAFDFLFATEEFPTQQVTDIFGVFVNGTNFARFADGSLIANQPGNPTNFINNPVGAGLYATQYNGLTRVLSLVGLIDPSLTTQTLAIGLQDTTDARFDSGVFITNLRAINTQGGGGINPGPQPVPAPAGAAVLVLGLLGLAAARRHR
jgi:hypothetical protein